MEITPAESDRALSSYRLLTKDQQGEMQKAIAEKIGSLIGVHGDIAVLVEYISVMLQSDKHRDLIVQELEAFLQDQSRPFVAWLCQQLGVFAGAQLANCRGDLNPQTDDVQNACPAAKITPVDVAGRNGASTVEVGGKEAAAQSRERSRSKRRGAPETQPLGRGARGVAANLLRRAVRDAQRSISAATEEASEDPPVERLDRKHAKLVPRSSPAEETANRALMTRQRWPAPEAQVEGGHDGTCRGRSASCDSSSESYTAEGMASASGRTTVQSSIHDAMRVINSGRVRPERPVVILQESPDIRSRAAAASAAVAAAARSAAQPPPSRRGGSPLCGSRTSPPMIPPPRPRRAPLPPPARPLPPRLNPGVHLDDARLGYATRPWSPGHDQHVQLAGKPEDDRGIPWWHSGCCPVPMPRPVPGPHIGGRFLPHEALQLGAHSPPGPWAVPGGVASSAMLNPPPHVAAMPPVRAAISMTAPRVGQPDVAQAPPGQVLPEVACASNLSKRNFAPQKWRVAASAAVQATEQLDSCEVRELRQGEIVESVGPPVTLPNGVVRLEIAHPSSAAYPDSIGWVTQDATAAGGSRYLEPGPQPVQAAIRPGRPGWRGGFRAHRARSFTNITWRPSTT